MIVNGQACADALCAYWGHTVFALMCTAGRERLGKVCNHASTLTLLSRGNHSQDALHR